jgi:hypothetical protein
MEWRYPNEIEKLKIKKMKQSFFLTPILSGISIYLAMIVLELIDKPAPFVVVLFTILFIIALYLQVTWIISLKCPRCNARATIPKGSCNKCGMKFTYHDDGIIDGKDT